MKLPRDIPMNEIDISDEELGLSWEEYKVEEKPCIIRELINTIEDLKKEIKKLTEGMKND